MTTSLSRSLNALLISLTLAACGGSPGATDAGTADASADMSAVNPDASPADAGLGNPDGSVTDSGIADSGNTDAGGADAGVECCVALDPSDQPGCTASGAIGYARCLGNELCDWPVVNADCPM